MRLEERRTIVRRNRILDEFKDRLLKLLGGLESLDGINHIVLYDSGNRWYSVDVRSEIYSNDNSVVFTGVFVVSEDMTLTRVVLRAGEVNCAEQNFNIRLNRGDEILINWIIKID